MRLLSAHIRDYRLHRDRSLTFDPRFTVICGPNQSGKSTLAEALHRSLFLPVKTGGAVLDGMRTDPFRAEPEVELVFESAGNTWILRKRFAGPRGSVSLQDSRGRGLQGDEAEERLAELIGTAAVARSRGAENQLRERWGHLWVWQGSASDNPLALGAQAYDHDRLVGRLQASADLGVQSKLDLAVVDAIQQRWTDVYTPGGANRAPQVRRGSELQKARAATDEARSQHARLEAELQQQDEARQAFETACEIQARVALELPQRQTERQVLERQLARSRELQSLIAQERPVLDGLVRELGELQADQVQLTSQGNRVSELEAAQAPGTVELEELQARGTTAEQELLQARQQLDGLRNTSTQATEAAEAIERRLGRARLLQEHQQLVARLEAAEALEKRLRELADDIERLPAINAKAVETLRQLEGTLQAARSRAEAMSTGLEVLRAGQPVLLDGEPLEVGATRQLSDPALLQLGDEVEVRVVPGGGTTARQAREQMLAAKAALHQALEGWALSSVEAAATAERRRTDLLAERDRLLEQPGAEQPTALREQLDELADQLTAYPEGPAGEPSAELKPEELISQLELELQEARAHRNQALAAAAAQQVVVGEAETGVARLREQAEACRQALKAGQDQLLEARTHIDAVLLRRGSLESLLAAIQTRQERQMQLEAQLTALQAELTALDPNGLDRAAQALDAAIAGLQFQNQEAKEARIRAESRLQGDGRVDLPAELEQKQAELECCLADQERLEKEAGMLTLLRRLLEEEQNALASEYSAPLTSRIGTYLAEVFPDVPRMDLSYEARGGFRGLQWQRRGEAAFSFEVLSTGAREQFAAALRLAMADVLSEAYDGCLPLVFDDAFAHSDPDRQLGVYRMLEQAAERGLQVILLTCDPERTEAIAATTRVELSSSPS